MGEQPLVFVDVNMQPHDRAADVWPYRAMTPEQYTALHADTLGHLGLEEWAHKPEVYEWLCEVDAIRRDPERLAAARRANATNATS